MNTGNTGNRKKKKQKKDPRNGQRREILVVTYLFVAIFLATMAYFVYFISNKSGEIINSPYNSRQDLLAKKIVRGEIFSSDGQVLARTVPDGKGGETREYPYKNVFAHVVGYAAKGKMGLESAANFTLLTSNAFVGERVKNSLNDEKNRGDSLLTTLDTNLQQAAFDALGAYQGAIVALEPQSGRILAMVSKPDFDPNYIERQWEELTSDEEKGVLVNRAAQGLYPPGSTFKIVTALEYIRENMDTYTDYSYICKGSFQNGEDAIRCYHGQAHGTVDLRKSFAKSCNSSFANIGMLLDKKSFHETASQLLFNKKLPLQIPSSQSHLYLDEKTTGHETLQAAIGQGTTLTTPIHMAMITAAIADKGELKEPHLIDEVQTYNGVTVRRYAEKSYGRLMSEEEAAIMTDLMREVVLTGTGSKLKSASYTSCGKTGSAEYSSEEKGESHAWFTGFAPAENPRIVVTVIIEKAGSGGDYAVPIARRVFDAYFRSVYKELHADHETGAADNKTG